MPPVYGTTVQRQPILRMLWVLLLAQTPPLQGSSFRLPRPPQPLCATNAACTSGCVCPSATSSCDSGICKVGTLHVWPGSLLASRAAVLATLANKGLKTRLQLICKPNASCNPNCVCPAATHKCFGAGMQVCKVRQVSDDVMPACGTACSRLTRPCRVECSSVFSSLV